MRVFLPYLEFPLLLGPMMDHRGIKMRIGAHIIKMLAKFLNMIFISSQKFEGNCKILICGSGDLNNEALIHVNSMNEIITFKVSLNPRPGRCYI